MDSAVSDLAVGILSLILGVPVMFLAIAASLTIRDPFESDCPRCHWHLGARVAPMRAQLLMFGSALCFILGLLFGTLGFIAAVVELAGGGREWASFLTIFLVAAPIFYAGAKGMAAHRKFRLKKCGNPACGWTLPKELPPSALITKRVNETPPASIASLAEQRALGTLIGVFHRRRLNPFQARKRLYVFEHGLVYQRRSGTVFRWDEVDSITYEPVSYMSGAAHLRTGFRFDIRAGRGRLKLTPSWSGIGIAGPHIAIRVAQAKFPDAQRTIAEGRSIDFRRWQLSSAGLTSKTTGLLPWAQVQRFTIERDEELGAAVIVTSAPSPQRPWDLQLASWIPNLDLLEMLLDQHTTALTGVDRRPSVEP